VTVATPAGSRYLQYSFAPQTDIINAFLQSLIGLYDYWKASGDAQAGQMFAAGNAQALSELPPFDTGAWSLYQPGVEDSLSYHELVTGFLDQRCSPTSTATYCSIAQHFHAYNKIPPSLGLLTARASAKTRFAVRFRLSKVSHVGIVLTRGNSTVFLTSASFGYGLNSFAVPALAPGTYGVRLAATDLAGNFNRITGTLQLTPPKRHSSGASGTKPSH
jgi:D-glucuronyl C5-epimerase-like protein